jgi:formylglycine-generating enzyme required for sulfatase activity
LVSLDAEFVLIPAGEFLMGSTDYPARLDEQPVHTVNISQPFYLGKYPVTQAQWESVMHNNPSRFKGDLNRPVESISWEDVQAYIRKLNEREGDMRYRLPTEAEWEYTARAGSTTAYSFGDAREQLDAYAWYKQNSGKTTVCGAAEVDHDAGGTDDVTSS